MLVGDMAIALNLLSVAVLAFVIGIVSVAVLSRFELFRLNQINFNSQKFILWSLVSAPWWIALSCIGYFMPYSLGFDKVFNTSWFEDFAHWHHIDIFSFSSWHGLTLLLASIYLAWRVTKTIYARTKQSIALSSLLSFTDAQDAKTTNGNQYYLMPVKVPVAFTSGFMSPKIYVSTGLQAQVSDEQLNIIVNHELAHVTARDPLFKVLFTTLASFYTSGIKQSLIEQYVLVTEKIADNEVTKAYDNLDVAQTLIDVARLQKTLPTNYDQASVSYFGHDYTSLRVEQLLNPINKPSLTTIIIALALLAAMPVLAASAVDSFHHFIETFFIH
ncbi:MAG: M56 family metallopeptidase [Aliiglaciecola sp.]|uniref:M56 family metallopeptidase n=1 Tax=Aliiglaciecola sp. TaxID=1872441 RepID=UPI003297187A